MVPQKILAEILRIESLKSAETAFQSNLIGNFFILFLQQLFLILYFIVNHSFVYITLILHLRLRLQLRVAIYQDYA